MNSNLHSHWSHDDLFDRLYGLDPRAGLDIAHLDACPDCGRAWALLTQRRESVVNGLSQAGALAEARLRAQRAAVLDRVEQPWAAPLWRMVPAGAMALLLVAGVLLHQPSPAPVETATNHQTTTVSDAELFTEAADMADLDGSRTTQTIQALFEPRSEIEVQ